jgi:hypothetical protein
VLEEEVGGGSNEEARTHMVPCQYVRGLVSEDGRNLILGAEQVQQTSVNNHLPSRDDECIGDG